MKHGQLDEDGRCILSGLKPGECAGCQDDEAELSSQRVPVEIHWPTFVESEDW
jgi:hypothetical protein